MPVHLKDKPVADRARSTSIVRLKFAAGAGSNERLVIPPALQACAEHQYAYNFFNDACWDGRLPEVILTYTRKKNCLGYFAPDRFQNLDGSVVSEVALNASYLAVRSDRDSLSTFVHEMVHVWRHYLGPLNRKGKRGTTGYHCKPWAVEMMRIGLIPSDTGAPGGKPTGYRMTHFIEEGGLFDKACADLLATGFRISWSDRIVRPNFPGTGPLGGGDDPNATAKNKKRDRIKFTCSREGCGLNAWAKPSALLICGICRVPMHPAETLVEGQS